MVYTVYLDKLPRLYTKISLYEHSHKEEFFSVKAAQTQKVMEYAIFHLT